MFEPPAFQLVADLPLPPELQPPQLSSQLLSVTETIGNAKKRSASEKNRNAETLLPFIFTYLRILSQSC